MNFPPRKIMRMGDMQALVVDDSPFMSELVTALMRTLGFSNVLHCLEGGQALDALKSFRPNVIVTDWAMKPINGIDFVKSFIQRHEPGQSHTPVIMLTANTEREHVIEARDAGVSDILAKPVSPQLVYNRVMRVLKSPKPLAPAAASAENADDEIWFD